MIMYMRSPVLMSRLCCVLVSVLVWYLTRYFLAWQSFLLHCS